MLTRVRRQTTLWPVEAGLWLSHVFGIAARTGEHLERSREALMARAWDTAVEQAADVLAEMLVELANGEAEHSHEDIAAGVLKTGLNTLLGETPASDRVEDVARVIYERIHDKENQTWSALPPRQKAFWLDIARAAIQASDGTLLRKIDV